MGRTTRQFNIRLRPEILQRMVEIAEKRGVSAYLLGSRVITAFVAKRKEPQC